jgi:hypothetical protein
MQFFQNVAVWKEEAVVISDDDDDGDAPEAPPTLRPRSEALDEVSAQLALPTAPALKKYKIAQHIDTVFQCRSSSWQLWRLVLMQKTTCLSERWEGVPCVLAGWCV